jgi:hypothetical protein
LILGLDERFSNREAKETMASHSKDSTLSILQPDHFCGRYICALPGTSSCKPTESAKSAGVLESSVVRVGRNDEGDPRRPRTLKQSNHIRVVCFMTDATSVTTSRSWRGEAVSNARVFSFGIGESANHFLLDKMAEAGRGEVEYVALNDDGSAAAKRFHERVRSPLLTILISTGAVSQSPMSIQSGFPISSVRSR